jgi:hypothetical protein
MKMGFSSHVEKRETEERETGRILDWTPAFLRKSILLTFSSVYLACVVGLIALYIVSSAHGGLIEDKKQNAELWKFGPAAGRSL